MSPGDEIRVLICAVFFSENLPCLREFFKKCQGVRVFTRISCHWKYFEHRGSKLPAALGSGWQRIISFYINFWVPLYNTSPGELEFRIMMIKKNRQVIEITLQFPCLWLARCPIIIKSMANNIQYNPGLQLEMLRNYYVRYTNIISHIWYAIYYCSQIQFV